MSEDRKVNLVFAAENQTKGTLQEIKQDVANTATSVEQSGKKAAKGIEAMGEGGEKAASKLDGSTRSIINSIQRTTATVEAGEKGSAKYFETLAKQRGIGGDALEPYLAQLRKAEAAQAASVGSLNNMGMSAKATAAALRGVPAQFTDIVTSLQGGQQPLTVFLQQGGQLKDMFGGAGAAAKALGGYVVGLVNPFTIAAAGAAALGVAYYQGRKEADNFRMAIVTTGNASGVTTSQLREYARQIESITGTQAQAASGLAAFVAAGVRGGSELKRFAQTAIEWEKATGQAVEKTAEQFAALQKDPLAATLKLNDGTNYLTASVYEQIKALEEQGRKTDAAKVAMDAYGNAMDGRSAQILASLGYLERGWNGVTGAAKKAWDAMLNVGRASTPADALSEIRKELSDLEKRSTGGFGDTEGGAATGRQSQQATQRIRERVEALRVQERQLAANLGTEEKSAAAQAESARAMQASTAFDKEYSKALEKQLTLQERLDAVRRKGVEGGKSEADIKAALTYVTEQYNKENSKSLAAAKAQEHSYATRMASIKAKVELNAEELSGASRLTEADKLRLKLQAQLDSGAKTLSASQRAGAKALLETLDAQERDLRARKASIALYAEQQDSLGELVAAERALYTAKVAMRTASDRANETLADQEKRMALEVSLIGQTTAARNLQLAQLEAEIELRKELDAIDANRDVDSEAREEARASAQVRYTRKLALAQRKVYVDEWEKTSQMVAQTLSDYIMAGGKDAATYLKRLFATLVLQPVVQYGVSSAMGALGMGQQGKDLQSVLGGNNVGTTVLNNSGMIGAGYQAAFGASVGASSASLVGANAAGMMGGDALGALIAGNGGWAGVSAAGGASAAAGGASAAGSLMSGIAAAAPYLAAVVALYAIISGMDDSGTPHSGAGAVYSKATGVQTGAEIYNQGTFGMGARDEYNAEMQAGISGIAQGLGQTLDTFAVSFGKTAGYSVATAFADDSSKDGAWGSLKIMDELGNKLVDWADTRSSKWAPREFADGEEGYKQYLAAVATDVKGAFLAMDLPAWADQLLATANDIDTLNTALAQIGAVKTVFDGLGKSMSMFADISGEAQTALLNVAGGIDALSSVAGSYYQAVYSEQERLEHARAQMEATLASYGATVPATREQYRALVEQQMAAGEAGAKFAVVLMGLAGIFGSVVDSIDAEFAGLADSVKGVFEPLLGSIGDLRNEIEATVAQIKRGAEAMSAEDIRAAIAGVAGVVAPGTGGVDAAGAGVASAAAQLATRQAANDAAQALAQGKLGGMQSATAKRDGILSEQERLQGAVSKAKSEHARFEDGGDLRGYSYNTRVTWMNHWAAEMLKAQQQLDALSPSLAAYNAEVAAQQAAYNAVQGAAQGPAEQLAAAQAALVAAQQAEVQAKADYAKEVNAFVASAGASVVKLGDLREEVVQYYEAQAQAVQSMIATAKNLRDVVGSIRLGQLDSAQTAAQLSGTYARDYSLALATTGSVRAGYADSMGSTLPALAEALKTEAETSADWRVQTAKLLAQAAGVAGLVEADAAGSDYQDQALGLLGSIDEALLRLDVGTKSAEQVIAQAIENGTSAQLAGLRAIVAALQGEAIPAFASGGMHMGGLRLVGERGPELEATGPSRIWNAQQTRALMSGDGGGDNAALVAEMRGLREDNRALQEAMVRQQADMNRLLMRWETQGMPEERVV